MKMRRGAAVGFTALGLAAASCSVEKNVPMLAGPDASASASAESFAEPAALARVAELRARFRIPMPVATRFEAAAGADATTHMQAVLGADVLRDVARPARVALPRHANDEVKLEDGRSRLSLRFALENVHDTPVEIAGGFALYRGAFDTGNARADVLHRVHAEGTEDYVVFEKRPGIEELRYAVDVSRVPGLRLVSNTLEFLDDGGTPLLRVSPPYVVDVHGHRHPARLAVNGCAYDTSPAGPWGRKVTRPGADRCSVHVAWDGNITYPAMVDPAWAATGSMITARSRHTATVLASGKVLVAGGYGSTHLASAELFDPAGNAGAGTFAATASMATARSYHSAILLPSGKVLVAGGILLAGNAEIFDPAGSAGAGTFVATGSMADARWRYAATLLPSGKVLIAGGSTNGSAGELATAEIFDPAGNAGAGTFTATAAMSVARTDHTASALPSGKVLIAGGSNTNGFFTHPSAEIFDPAGNAGAGTFTATANMLGARMYHSASVLPSGKVLVAGGRALTTPLLSAELFDPSGNAGAGTFVATGGMKAARHGHTASLLSTGLVVLVGGRDSSGIVPSTELFDPAGAGTFALTTPIGSTRTEHTANPLPSGRLLVVGGYDGAANLASAVHYGGALGDACTASTSCLSGACVDGVCCNSACSGGCDRCDLTGKQGTCTPAPEGDPGASPACAFPLACDGVSATCAATCASDIACAAGHYCATNGSCQPRKPQAAACNTQIDCKEPGCRACASGFCRDGFCCDTACSGTCQACGAALKQDGLADGTCGFTKLGLDPRDECKDGKTCDGTGACPTGATCDGDHTTTGSDGTKQDCAPYRCLSTGACRDTCTSVTDCVAPTVCDAAGKCVPPADDAAGDGGCSVVRPNHGEAPWTAWLAAVACLALARRRRTSRLD